MITIEEIKKLMQEATQGKWTRYYSNCVGVSDGDGTFTHICEIKYGRNADLIAALPEVAQLAIDLAEENEKLKVERELIRKAMQDAQQEMAREHVKDINNYLSKD